MGSYYSLNERLLIHDMGIIATMGTLKVGTLMR